MANIAYVRVSTAEQNESRQLKAIEPYHIDKLFMEKVSGKDKNREQLSLMLDYVREGDTVYVCDFSRLARNTKDLLDIVDMLNSKGITLISLKESLDTSTPAGKLMLTMLGAIAEFERSVILERQREGIQIAKMNGKYQGRKPISVDDDVFEKAFGRYLNRELNKTELARELHVSRPTLDKMIKEKTA